jgi:F-type H+-transporting ATPase subunit epsilon
MLVKVITPEKEVFNEKARSVNLPTEAGYLTILPNHTELLSVIHSGEIIIEFESGTKKFKTEGGVIEVFKNEVNLLLKKGL